MSRPQVFLTGGDGIGWAVDEDMKLIREALVDIVDFVDLPESQVIHSLWWEGLMMIPAEQLSGKRILCHIPGEPFRYFTMPRHRHALPIVGKWVTRNSQAAAQMSSLGISHMMIPYLIDVGTFRPLYSGDKNLTLFLEKWGIPSDAYLIGNFSRDTEGSDLRTPKLVKGPDLLLEILLALRRQGLNIHVVIAGPRRHWLLRRLTQEHMPFTYIGCVTEADDIETNCLPRSTLNILYNIVDLYIVSSRSEGGPHAILEASAARCKIISTPVGIARDMLQKTAIFESVGEAVDIVRKDISQNSLAHTTDINFERVYQTHRPSAVVPLLSALYGSMHTVPPCERLEGGGRTQDPESVIIGDSDRIHITPFKKRHLTVGLWHKFFQPPYGGGNQFMMGLRKALVKRGIQVRENELSEDIDAYVLNSIHFDVDLFLEFGQKHRLNVIHRIDGPIHLIRGYDREKDELCYRLNAQFASATVLQSAWTYQRIVEMGYNPISPVIIHNAVDSDIFHSLDRVPFNRNRKIRLISTSWSDNPRKGGPTYKWIEEHLDWNRFEYTFVGNVSEKLSRIRHVAPVSSEELAGILRTHDIYVTASQNDPCSNALIEAMACGLPALYLNDGGHPELVGYGGLSFDNEQEILPSLEKLVENYESFQSLIAVSKLEDVAEKYLSLIREVVQ
jgi:glycosyltransferase involved in cell wall biosynthesis